MISSMLMPNILMGFFNIPILSSWFRFMFVSTFQHHAGILIAKTQFEFLVTCVIGIVKSDQNLLTDHPPIKSAITIKMLIVNL